MDVRTNVPQSRSKKILIVEDHDSMRHLLSVEISLMGFEAVTASGGKEGVAKAVAEKPDLVLLDIMMPEMDGWDVARNLRAHPETKDIPIVAETALFSQRELNTCLQAGCDDYLVKPFTYEDLEDKVRAFTREPFADRIARSSRNSGANESGKGKTLPILSRNDSLTCEQTI
jgi:DNA-binding response OmpR family regulator